MRVFPSILLLPSVSLQAVCLITSRCCTALEHTTLRDKVLYPNSPAYEQSLSGYVSNDTCLEPSCIVQPRSTADVSLIISTLVLANDGSPECHFAVRSGAHSAVPGANNAQNGVTIDLTTLNRTVYRPGSDTVSVQMGSRWSALYEVLVKHDVAVVGGRYGEVGLGGLTLGGGISFHSAQKGLVCDNVVNYEIVLANATITNANSTHNADLFRALKGGLSNFGIVTTITMPVFKQGPLWGGELFYPGNTTSQNTDAVASFIRNIDEDNRASILSFFSYASALDDMVIVHTVSYTDPVPYPAPFKQFYGIQNTSSTLRLADLHNITRGDRNYFMPHATGFTITHLPDDRVFRKNAEIQQAAISKAKAYTRSKDWSIGLSYQPFPASFVRPGNVLGLDKENNYAMLATGFIWNSTAHSDFFINLSKTMLQEIELYASEIGAMGDFIYINYASEYQDPIGSYGEENVRFLSSVSRKYDPEGVFQKQMPGGFKLG